MSGLKKNYIYHFSYQIINTVFSVILLPYLSRVLGPNGIGVYSYTHSIVSYFALFMILGIKNYGNRLIASIRDDKQERSKQFWSLYVVQLLFSGLTILFYIIYSVFICKNDQIITFAQTIFLISSMFDISWFFCGIEKFKITNIINSIVKIVAALLVFVLVRNENDLLIYTIIMGAYPLLQNILLFPLLRKEIKLIKFNKEEFAVHIKPCIILFIPLLAVSFYKIMDKIILGTISGSAEVGFYRQVERITEIPLCIVSSLATVIFPKVTYLFAKGESYRVKKYIENSITFVMFLIFPIIFGIIAVADNFIFVFLGKEFMKCADLLKVMIVSIFFISWANIIRMEYIVPKKKDKLYALSVCAGAIINVVLNIVLIPNYKALGAVIANLSAEFTVAFIQTIVVRKSLDILSYMKNILPLLFKSIIMMVIVIIVGYFHIENVILKLILQVLVGIITYFALNISYVKEIIKSLPFLKKWEK